MVKAKLHNGTKATILTAVFLTIGFITVVPTRCQCQPIDAPPCRFVLRTHQGPLRAHHLSNDDRALLTLGQDGSAMIWDVATGSRRHFIKKQAEGGSLKIWDVMSENQKRLIVGQPGGAAGIGYTLAPDSLHLSVMVYGTAVGGQPNDGIYIYNLENGKVQRIYDGSENNHSSIGLAGDEWEWPISKRNRMAYTVGAFDPQHGGTSFKILIDDLTEAAHVVKIADEPGCLYSGYSFSNDGGAFCTVSMPAAMRRGRGLPVGRVMLWNPRTGQKIARLETSGRDVAYPRFSPNGRDLAILGGKSSNVIYVYSMAELKIRRTLTDYQKRPGHGRIALGSIFYTADGSYLVAYGADGTIMFWETRDYREVLWVKLYPNAVQCLWFSADGRMLSTGGEKNEWDAVKFWDLDQFRSLIRGGGS